MLRILALLYAFVFFMAEIFPALLFPDDRKLGEGGEWARSGEPDIACWQGLPPSS